MEDNEKASEMATVVATPPLDALDSGEGANSKDSMDNLVVELESLPSSKQKPVATSGVSAEARCGLCGGGNDGEPPRELWLDPEAKYSMASVEVAGERWKHTEKGKMARDIEVEELGEGPGWLGPLLGPISERIGVAGVWVHRRCAIWSPEVYFKGTRLKNVQAAIRRGRALKCSRCDRPGATIGCRVDRCSRSYHLPCARFEGCYFEFHPTYLIACKAHIPLFKLQKRLQAFSKHGRIRRGPPGRKGAKPRRDLLLSAILSDHQLAAAAALKKDLEADSRERELAMDEDDFLQKERLRLQRDIARMVPVKLGDAKDGEGGGSGFPAGWESVGGLKEVVRCLKEMVILPLAYPEAFEHMKIALPRGVLLYGHPGTGKTLVARALAGACARGSQQVSYFARKGADCLGKYVGDAERQLRLLFQVAEQCQPSIIFFDEIDGLAPSRYGRQEDQTHSSVVSTLLALMDGVSSRGSVVVIGATNRPESLDPALRRPGRFDRELYFPLPSMPDRAAILQVHTCNWDPPPSPNLLRLVAEATPGFAGADLAALCTSACMAGLRRTCPLQKTLDASSTVSLPNRAEQPPPLPELPQVRVIAADWMAALAQAPPPCARRSAISAIAESPAAPLPHHLSSLLGLPIIKILRGLSGDGRVRLPAKVAQALATLPLLAEQGGLNGAPTPCTSAKQAGSGHAFAGIGMHVDGGSVERVLIECGLLGASPGGEAAEAVDLPGGNLEVGEEDSDEEDEMVVGQSGKKLDVESFVGGAGFRVLLTGKGQQGQLPVAAALLQAFEGSATVKVLSLPTALLDGGGQVACGVVHILAEAQRASPCILFMPQIDNWAMKIASGERAAPTPSDSRGGRGHDAQSSTSMGEGLGDGCLQASEEWKVFLQQIRLLPRSLPIMLVATSHVSKQKLSPLVQAFFGTVPSDATTAAKRAATTGNGAGPHASALSGVRATPRNNSGPPVRSSPRVQSNGRPLSASHAPHGRSTPLNPGPPSTSQQPSATAKGLWAEVATACVELPPVTRSDTAGILQRAAESVACSLAWQSVSRYVGMLRQSAKLAKQNKEAAKFPRPWQSKRSLREKSEAADVTEDARKRVRLNPAVELVNLTGEGSPEKEEAEKRVGTKKERGDGGLPATTSPVGGVGLDRPAVPAGQAAADEKFFMTKEQCTVQAALHWCGMQLLRSSRLKRVRRFSVGIKVPGFSGGMLGGSLGRRYSSGGGTSSGGDGVAEAKGPETLFEERGGLYIVGALACQGGFTSGHELTVVVRKVVREIQKRAEKEGIFWMRSQAAALEDMVGCWEFATHRLEVAAQVSLSLLPEDARARALASARRSSISGRGQKPAPQDNAKSCQPLNTPASARAASPDPVNTAEVPIPSDTVPAENDIAEQAYKEEALPDGNEDISPANQSRSRRELGQGDSTAKEHLPATRIRARGAIEREGGTPKGLAATESEIAGPSTAGQSVCPPQAEEDGAAHGIASAIGDGQGPVGPSGEGIADGNVSKRQRVSLTWRPDCFGGLVRALHRFLCSRLEVQSAASSLDELEEIIRGCAMHLSSLVKSSLLKSAGASGADEEEVSYFKACSCPPNSDALANNHSTFCLAQLVHVVEDLL